MYEVTKRMEISAAHQLDLDYESKCRSLHGHNWIVTVHVRSETLDRNGMVCDFTKIKSEIHGRLDHQYLNDALGMNPTAENIARWVHDRIPGCFRVDVQESEGNVASYMDRCRVVRRTRRQGLRKTRGQAQGGLRHPKGGTGSRSHAVPPSRGSAPQCGMPWMPGCGRYKRFRDDPAPLHAQEGCHDGGDALQGGNAGHARPMAFGGARLGRVSMGGETCSG